MTLLFTDCDSHMYCIGIEEEVKKQVAHNITARVAAEMTSDKVLRLIEDRVSHAAPNCLILL